MRAYLWEALFASGVLVTAIAGALIALPLGVGLAGAGLVAASLIGARADAERFKRGR